MHAMKMAQVGKNVTAWRDATYALQTTAKIYDHV